MRIGLFFGSFNPVHIGHMVIANYMVSFTDLNQLWFVVSPQNPLKNNDLLLEDRFRFEMLRIAVGDDEHLKVSDIEFGLSKPSFTINTLNHLRNLYPGHTFVITMGADGIASFNKWKNYREIIDHYERYIYPRPGIQVAHLMETENCKFFDAPVIEISSTFIRQAIRKRKDVKHFLPAGVYEYIKDNGLYF